jgi:putative endonuclease
MHNKTRLNTNRSNTNRLNTKYYVYSLNLEDGKKYVGHTNNMERRMGEHINGYGAKWTKKHPVESINRVTVCNSHTEAKKLETEVYYKMKNYHGKKVRGAGYTKSF